MPIKTINITIEGRTPLLCNRFPTEQKEDTSATQNDVLSPKDEAFNSLYITDNNDWYIPGSNILRCMIDAGKYFSGPKNTKLTTGKSSVISGAVMVNTDVCIIDDGDEGWSIDKRAVRIPTTGGRVLKHRARFDNWKLSFELELDSSIITMKTFRELVEAAGSRIGLGDFRPDTKGPFGRFRIAEWKIGS